MVYTSVNELPAYVKKYDSKLQRQWLYTANTVYESTESLERAMKAANSVLKTRFKKRDSMVNNSHHDFFNHVVDRWLGRLKG